MKQQSSNIKDFLNEFVDLCKKYGLPIDEQSVFLNVGPLIMEDATRSSWGIIRREIVLGKEFTLKFKTLENQEIYEREI